MKIFYYFSLIIFSSFSLTAFADKESEKGRLDDCFNGLEEMSREVNSKNGRDSDLNRRFLDKKKRCFDIKAQYEKKYGKYSIPNYMKKVKQTPLYRYSVDDLVNSFCHVKGLVRENKTQVEMQSDNPNLKDSVAQIKESIRGYEKDIEKIKAAYKKKTKRSLKDDDCNPKIFTEEKYIRYLGQRAECSGDPVKCISDDKNPKALEKIFCTTKDSKKRSVLNKLYKKLTGKNVFCSY